MGAPRQFRKKPVVIEAAQWWKNGDHPGDALPPADRIGDGERREGAVVRYFRYPPVDPATGEISTDDGAVLLGGMRHCDTPQRFRRETCKAVMHDHGWIDTLEGGHTVCPGDWVITGVQGEVYPCKPDIFAATYDIVDGPDADGDRPRTAPEHITAAQELSGFIGSDRWLKADERSAGPTDVALAQMHALVAIALLIEEAHRPVGIRPGNDPVELSPRIAAAAAHPR